MEATSLQNNAIDRSREPRLDPGVMPEGEELSSGYLRKKVAMRLAELGFNQAQMAVATNIDKGTLSRYLNGRLKPPPERIKAIALFLQLPISTLQAWADEDRLGEDRSRELARQVLADDPTTLAAELFLGRPSGPDISTEPLTAAELGRVVEALAAADPASRQKILKTLPAGTLAKLRGALFGPGPVPSEEERRTREDPPEKAV